MFCNKFLIASKWHITALMLASGFFSIELLAQDSDPTTELSSELAPARKIDFLAGSIGDSITVAFDARFPLANQGINWSTGTLSAQLVNSHALRLQDLMPDQVVGTKNFAIAGSMSSDVVKQAARLAKFHPDYVTVLIGANDVCSWQVNHLTQLQKYESDIQLILKTLIASNEAVKILVSAIPNMPLLREIGAANGCQSRWTSLHICPALLGSRQTDAERAAFAGRWEDANEVLARVSAAFPENVKFASSVSEPIFIFSHLSRLDCFHPNVTGQNLLSETTWEESWFY